jgi:hypothetical protein
MANIIDDDKLSSIFNLEDVDEINIDDIDLSDYTDDCEDDEVIDVDSETVAVETKEVVQPEPKSDSDFVNTELKSLLNTTHKLMEAASFILNGAPDAETIASASTLVGSIKDVISEINKSVLIEKRFEEQTKLEQMKIEARTNLEQLKAKHKKPELGSNNTFIQNNTSNTIAAGSQEDIIDMIRDIQKGADQEVKKLK